MVDISLCGDDSGRFAPAAVLAATRIMERVVF
jgi:hypothetical protein